MTIFEFTLLIWIGSLTIVWGTIPLGAFIGGILGTSIGLVQTIVLGGILSTLAAAWIVLGPVIRLREQPATVMA